ncbi:MAG: 30S ribosomal protein S17 [bacterium]
MEKELENISEEETLGTTANTQNETDYEELQVTTEVADEIIEIEAIAETISIPDVKVEESVKVKATKKVLQGKVVSNKPDKTVIIKVERQVSHPIYKKYYKKTKKFMAHDERNDCNIGDVIRIRECRPLSAKKSWELVEIVERAK